MLETEHWYQYNTMTYLVGNILGTQSRYLFYAEMFHSTFDPKQYSNLLEQKLT